MARRKRRNVGDVDFECPNCGREYHRTLWEEIEDDGLGGPVTSDAVACKCGAVLFCADDYENVNVYWLNKREMREMTRNYILKSKIKLRPAVGLYYDLIRVPHGHVPVGKVWLWKRFPLLIKQVRDDKFFKCSQCGSPSFFKTNHCPNCTCWFHPNRLHILARRDYFRNLAKSLEILVLPVLALLGKAWYVHSERLHFRDDYRRRRYSY